MGRFRGKPLTSGFVLPSVIILSLVILTLTANWYRQVTVQSYLAERVIDQKALLSECKSLIPYLKMKLGELSSEEIIQEQPDFVILKDGQSIRWKIDRSAWINNKVKFSFFASNNIARPDKIVLTTQYLIIQQKKD